jgi:hypothetical protein
MFGRPPKLSALDDALLEVVTDAVPRGSAHIERSWSADERCWLVTVTPNDPDACPFALGARPRDEVRFVVGGTTFDLYGVRRSADLGFTRRLVEAIIAGRVEESGSGRSSQVRLALDRKETYVGGRTRVRAPWPLRSAPRTFARYA